jgi:hypothetical protein
LRTERYGPRIENAEVGNRTNISGGEASAGRRNCMLMSVTRLKLLFFYEYSRSTLVRKKSLFKKSLEDAEIIFHCTV